MNDQFLSLLGLSRVSQKAAFGFDAAVKAMKTSRVHLLVSACDLSAKTKKELEFHCSETGTHILRSRYSIFEITAAVGLKTGVVAITDWGFAQRANAIYKGDNYI